MTNEVPVCVECAGDALLGIVHKPARPNRRGLVIVVGGPQYRVGSHRQFLMLARGLAEAGIAVMRFDYRGMADSDGAFRGFEDIGADVAAAIDVFTETVPEIEEVALWGLCDAASAILFYAHTDPRVTGIVALNPWARTEAGIARTYLRHYYLRRLTERALWRKVWRGEFEAASALRSLLANARRALGAGHRDERVPAEAAMAAAPAAPLPERMAAGLVRFRGQVLIVLSGSDLTAHEFEDTAAASRAWRRLLAAKRVTRHRLTDADHTFSRRAWRDQVSAWTREWMVSW